MFTCVCSCVHPFGYMYTDVNVLSLCISLLMHHLFTERSTPRARGMSLSESGFVEYCFMSFRCVVCLAPCLIFEATYTVISRSSSPGKPWSRRRGYPPPSLSASRRVVSRKLPRSGGWSRCEPRNVPCVWHPEVVFCQVICWRPGVPKPKQHTFPERSGFSALRLSAARPTNSRV